MSFSRRTPEFVLAVAALLLAVGPAPTKAAFVLTVDSSSAPVGGIGSFDVVVSSTGGTFSVSGFSVELSVAGGSGVTFTGANINTTAAPYIFGTLQAPPLSFNSFPNTDFIASDTDFTDPGFINVTPTNSFGLEHVTYSVAPGTALGPITVSIDGIGTTTSFFDLVGNPIPFTPTNGIITVTSAIPEPSSLCLLSTSLIGMSLILRVRRRLA